MPGALGSHAAFGAKLISVFHQNSARGVQSHQGLVVLFDPDTGTPICILHAGEITAIRTAAASAVATDALARKDASRLALLGYGEQAKTHARAIHKIAHSNPSLSGAGRMSRARAFAEQMQAELDVTVVTSESVREAVADAGHHLYSDLCARTDPERRLGKAGNTSECSGLELCWTRGSRQRCGRAFPIHRDGQTRAFGNKEPSSFGPRLPT